MLRALGKLGNVAVLVVLSGILAVTIGLAVEGVTGELELTEAAELRGGGGFPNKTVFECPRLDGLGHSEILVGYSYDMATPTWYRYCVQVLPSPNGVNYVRTADRFWKADTRHGGPGKAVPFYEGEVVLLEDSEALAYYGGRWSEGKIIIVNGPGFFMRSKETGFATGNALINPPGDKLRGMPYLGNPQLPPPTDFLLPIPLWFDVESAVNKTSCWEWEGRALIFPECINFSEEPELHTTIKTPFAPIPPTPEGILFPEEVMEKWCVAGFCEKPGRFLYPEENGKILTRTTVIVTPGTGLLLSLPPNTWAFYSSGVTVSTTDPTPRQNWTTAFGPDLIYIQEGKLMRN